MNMILSVIIMIISINLNTFKFKCTKNFISIVSQRKQFFGTSTACHALHEWIKTKDTGSAIANERQGWAELGSVFSTKELVVCNNKTPEFLVL